MISETGISVSELNQMVAEAIRRDPRTRSVTVRGEVSSFKHHIPSGHWYFSLKDSQAAVSCMMYRTAAVRAQIRPKDGDLVLADGYVDMYLPQGKVQLYVTALRSAGLGDLYVTIFSGRTRRCGVLMGKGLNYDEVTEALAGITLESLVITRVMGIAVKKKAALGLLDLKNFPLLMHIVEILDKGMADADLPWESFTFEQFR